MLLSGPGARFDVVDAGDVVVPGGFFRLSLKPSVVDTDIADTI